MAKMYTCDEVAERYKVKVITVWDWIRQHKLNAIKLGREYRISEEDEDLRRYRRTSANHPEPSLRRIHRNENHQKRYCELQIAWSSP